MYADQFEIYHGNSNPDLARKISRYLGAETGRLDVFQFANENIGAMTNPCCGDSGRREQRLRENRRRNSNRRVTLTSPGLSCGPWRSCPPPSRGGQFLRVYGLAWQIARRFESADIPGR